MSSYKPKSLDELNSMYDKALSAQRAIKRGTSKINESSSSNFFDDVIKEAEQTVTKQQEKPIADLSVAVDDFIKHFTQPNNEQSVSKADNNIQKTAPIQKQAAQKLQPEKKSAPITVSVPTPATPTISRKQSSEHISSLMSDYIKIMNDQDEPEDEERKPRRSFLSRKKDKKLSQKGTFKDEATEDENAEKEDEMLEDASLQPQGLQSLTDEDDAFEEIKEAVVPFEKDDETVPEQEDIPSIAGEEAFNAFSAMSEKKEDFYKEAEEVYTPDEDEVFEDFSSLSKEAQEETALEENEEKNVSNEADEKYKDEDSKKEEPTEDLEKISFKENKPDGKKNKNALRITLRAFLSLICLLTVSFSVLCACLSTVFNVNTGKEAFGEYYFFTSSHAFEDASVKANDLVICKKQATVTDGESAVYIDLENRTFSFGVKDGSKLSGDDDIIYVISGNEVDRNDVLGVVYKTIPSLGKTITVIYNYYVAIIVCLTIISAALLLIIIFVLKKKPSVAEISLSGEVDLSDEDEEDEDAEIDEESEDGEDLFTSLE